MNGAREYAELFHTGQYGKLYIVSGSHARGRTFEIYVLPEGEKAISNGEQNAPLNSSKVEVYGIISGQSGWTENYGWLHKGKWQEDFYNLVDMRKEENKRKEQERLRKENELAKTKEQVAQELLAKY